MCLPPRPGTQHASTPHSGSKVAFLFPDAGRAAPGVGAGSPRRWSGVEGSPGVHKSTGTVCGARDGVKWLRLGPR